MAGPAQHNIQVRGYKEHGNINTPLELAIRNRTDRFTLAMDAIDRILRLRATAAGVRDEQANQRIAREQYACRYGIDRPHISDWKWPIQDRLCPDATCGSGVRPPDPRGTGERTPRCAPTPLRCPIRRCRSGLPFRKWYLTTSKYRVVAGISLARECQ